MSKRMIGSGLAMRVGAGAVVLLSLAACTSQQTLRQTELALLLQQLPGAYDNLQQVQADAAAGQPDAHAAQALIIMRLQAPLVGDEVLLVRETAADDARRVTAERIWSLKVAAGGQIIATLARFEEPDRWRIGAQSPELFRSLLLRDLRIIEGCELLWQKTAAGFSGDTASNGCRRGGAAGGAAQTQHWRLAGETLDLGEAADTYRFRRRSNAE